MRSVLYVCAAVLTCVAGWLAWQYGAAKLLRGTESAFLANPEEGKVADASYRNDYFGLTYPLPPDWTAGTAGPDPSQTGYYVLALLISGSKSDSANILIAAQDMFFATDEHGSLADRARDFRQAVAKVGGMTIDGKLMELKVANHLLYRLDYSGVGLFRAAITTEIRCHLVSFNLTTRDPDSLNRLARSLDDLSFTTRDSGWSAPPCIKDYAVADNILHKVAPLPVGPKFVPIPVRIIVGADGSVKHVHVIRATDDQRRSIGEALYQWKFKPYEFKGRPSPVETGLVFKFKGDN